MSANNETQSSSLNSLKWIITIALLVVAIGGNHYYTEEVSVLYRAIAVVVLVALAGFLPARQRREEPFCRLRKKVVPKFERLSGHRVRKQLKQRLSLLLRPL